MDLLTEPVTKLPRRVPEATTSTEWLDLLSTGGCDRETFLEAVSQLWQRAPESGWELLAVLDQYYRRNKISAETFAAVKSHVQDLVMGKERGGEISIPVRRKLTPQTATLAVDPPVTPVPARSAQPIPAASSAVTGPVRPATARRASSVPISLPMASATMQGEPDQAAHADPVRTLTVGDILRDRYLVKAVLGQGGMGTVFEAVDQYRLDRANGEQKVALKVLHTAVIQRPRLFAELRREFQHLQSLSHPNIVRVHEFDRDGDLAFFTMEYLSGVPLMRVLTTHASDPLERSVAWSIVRDVGAAVAHAHSRGVVHGDLNPGNIFITDNGEVRVLDFGAAHPLRRTPWISDFESSQQINVATPSYASCQILEGETADARDDIYAMACVTYILLTGTHPFRDQSSLKARTSHLKPERPRNLTRGQWQALQEGLQFERERRPADMEAWLKRLGPGSAAAHLPVLPVLMAPRARRQSSMGWMVTVIAVVLVAAGTAWLALNADSVSGMTSAVSAKLKTQFADTVLSQLWANDRESTAAQPPARETMSPAPPGPTPKQTAISPAPAPVPRSVANTPPPAATVPASRLVATPSAAAVAGAPPAAPAAVPAPGVRARIELAADSVDVPPDDPIAHVVVHRNRSLRGEASFSWWTESGTAKPGRDFKPVQSHVETIPEGRNAADLMIPVIADPGRHEPRSFYVVIDEPSENATLGQRTLTMVTLP